MIRSGYAVITEDKKSKGKMWRIFGYKDQIGEPLALNESLVLPPAAFAVGTRVEVHERVE